MVLSYAKGGDLCSQLNRIYDKFNWKLKLNSLKNIIRGLKIIHQKQMVHRDFHTGNLLLYYDYLSMSINNMCISDMGLCKEVGNTDETKIYGVMPYVAPEVLREKPYTKAADIYSFGMIMYFIATGKQPFANCAHDEFLALNICNGIRPEINESEVPKCYIDLMKSCWDSNPDNRPNVVKVKELIDLFYHSYCYYDYSNDDSDDDKIEKQFEEAEEYRKANLLSFKPTTHSKAYYTSRLLNPFTKNLHSVEVIDFTK